MDLDISWHDDAWRKFINARAQHHFPHALLLSGSKGSGKKIFADKIVKSLLCTQAINYDACGNCPSCKTYKSGANPDYFGVHLEVDKQQISVDQIRNLSSFLNYTRSFDAYRVVLLEPVARMNRNATNSLLKSLEEPTDNTAIILITENVNSVLPTIKSRCQHLSLPLPAKEEAIRWIKKQKNSIENPDEALIFSNGSPLLAIDMPPELLNERNDFCNDLIEAINESKSITDIAKKWEKYDHGLLLDWQITWMQESIKSLLAHEKNKSPSKKLTNKLLLLINQFNITQQWQLYQSLINQKHYIHTSVNSLTFMENMIMLWLEARTSNQ